MLIVLGLNILEIYQTIYIICKIFFRGQPVEVVHLEDEEFEKEVDRFRPTFNQWPTTEIVIDDDEEEGDVNSNESNPQEFTCLVLEDLPTYIKEQDILKIFSDYSLLSISIVGKQRKNKVFLFTDTYHITSIKPCI